MHRTTSSTSSSGLWSSWCPARSRLFTGFHSPLRWETRALQRCHAFCPALLFWDIWMGIDRPTSLLPLWEKEERPPQFPVSNEHVAPPPAFCLISAGSSVQLSFERLSTTDPAVPSAAMPAMASVAKISLARRPVMVCLAPLNVSSQERAVMSTLLIRQTILSAVTEIFLA